MNFFFLLSLFLLLNRLLPFYFKVMVFVHARNATVRTAMALREKAKNNGHTCYFLPSQGPDYGQSEKQVSGYLAKY